MTFEKFNMLTQPQQHYYIIKRGTYLSSRHEKEFTVYLFQMAGYYAELYYEHGEIECSLTRAFNDFNQLDPYLQGINIKTLIDKI